MLDIELVQKLQQEPNASRLINGLLSDYFRKTDIALMDDAELEKQLEIKKTKLEALKKVRDIENADRR